MTNTPLWLLDVQQDLGSIKATLAGQGREIGEIKSKVDKIETRMGKVERFVPCNSKPNGVAGWVEGHPKASTASILVAAVTLLRIVDNLLGGL